jgi:hypothetical protein
MGKGSQYELPKEVFAALPKDPDQQLEVAQQITQIAVSGRVARLEADCSSLREKVAEKDAVIGGLQARVIGAETTLAETTAKLAIALEGQVLTEIILGPNHETTPLWISVPEFSQILFTCMRFGPTEVLIWWPRS